MNSSGDATPATRDEPQRGGFSLDARLVAAVALVAVAASATSLPNGFAYDDVFIIAENARVHSLSRWWEHFAAPYWPPHLGASLYRPLTTLAYALEWVVSRGTPLAFHAVNVGLYAAVSVAVFLLLRRLLTLLPALAGAALFAAHPLHTEPVANVVGQAELLAALAVLAAVRRYVAARGRDGPTAGDAAVLASLYLTGSLAKEHALLLPALLAAAEWLLVDSAQGWRVRVRRLAPLLVLLAAVGAAVLAARVVVTGSLLGERSVVEMDATTRLWTMFRVVPEWLRLFVWPAHLSAEYGPQQIEIVDGPSLSAFAGIALVVLAAVAFAAALRRERAPRATAFALAWLAVTLLPASNLVTGLVLEERTLFLPSVAVAILAGLGVERLSSRAVTRASSREAARAASAALTAAVMLLVVLGVARAAVRNPIWRDNATLFAQTVRDAPRSYRAHYVYGRTLFEQGSLADGERELREAIALAHNDADPFNYLATRYREVKAYGLAIPLYRQALAINPRRPDARFGLALSLLESGDPAGATREAQEGLRGGQLKSYFEWILTRADSVTRADSTPPNGSPTR